MRVTAEEFDARLLRIEEQADRMEEKLERIASQLDHYLKLRSLHADVESKTVDTIRGEEHHSSDTGM